MILCACACSGAVVVRLSSCDVPKFCQCLIVISAVPLVHVLHVVCSNIFAGLKTNSLL